jgi:putative Mg2+ transporter-C (MgtC) family protein
MSMMHDTFQELPAAEIGLRVGASILGGTLIGLERLWNHKIAGLKTNTLVSLGAGIFGLIATNSQMLPNWSASQFAIGVITGVGFLGSGIILQNSGSGQVQGVNSAATIWVSAGVGLACGMGECGLALVSLGGVLFVQFFHRWIENKVSPRPPRA